MNNRRTNVVPIQRLGEDFKQDQVAVTVNDQPGKLVGFTEDQAAGVGTLLQHAGPELNGLAQALVEQGHPGRVREVGVGGQQAKRDLRGWAPQRRAQGKTAMVGHRDQARIHFHQMLNIRTVDPHVAGTQPIRSPAGDHRDRPFAAWGAGGLAGGRGDGFTGHKSSSHRPPICPGCGSRAYVSSL